MNDATITTAFDFDFDFDFETALKQLQSGQALTGENGI
jgi:hypothetical protein